MISLHIVSNFPWISQSFDPSVHDTPAALHLHYFFLSPSLSSLFTFHSLSLTLCTSFSGISLRWPRNWPGLIFAILYLKRYIDLKMKTKIVHRLQMCGLVDWCASSWYKAWPVFGLASSVLCSRLITFTTTFSAFLFANMLRHYSCLHDQEMHVEVTYYILEIWIRSLFLIFIKVGLTMNMFYWIAFLIWNRKQIYVFEDDDKLIIVAFKTLNVFSSISLSLSLCNTFNPFWKLYDGNILEKNELAQ